MCHVGIWFSDEHSGAGVTVGIDLRGFFQAKDSIILS